MKKEVITMAVAPVEADKSAEGTRKGIHAPLLASEADRLRSREVTICAPVQIRAFAVLVAYLRLFRFVAGCHKARRGLNGLVSKGLPTRPGEICDKMKKVNKRSQKRATSVPWQG